MKNSLISTEFAGFNDWVEIFRGGQQTDSAGNPHDGDALVEKAVKTFDTAYHEPPAVLGHPKDNTPAFGWVSDLKAETKNGVKRLLARFKDVVPEFEEAVKSGRFKKRSSAFYPDGRLRHVGWLGAMPPAVKGLADVAFSDTDNAIKFEFTDNQQPEEKKEKVMKFSEFLEVFKFWKTVQNDPDAEFGEIGNTVSPPKAAPGFSEADLETAKKEAADAAREEGKKAAMAEFAEAESARKKAAAKAKIQVIIDDGVKNGTIAPAWKDGGLPEFMESLDTEETIEFGEGDGKKKKSGLDWFADFLEGLPELVNFDEVATRDKDVKTGDAAAKLEALVRDRMNENKDLTYGAAFCEVQQEHPGLAGEYQQELNS